MINVELFDEAEILMSILKHPQQQRKTTNETVAQLVLLWNN